MIMNLGDKISYIMELLTACLIFMIPMRKRKKFWLIESILIIFLIFSVFVLNLIYKPYPLGGIDFIYWGLYLIAAAIFSYVGIDGSWTQAIYCMVCASAMQHIAFDIYLIYKISGGTNLIINILIYIVVYSSFYYFYVSKLTENGLFTFKINTLFPIVTILMLVWILSIMESSILTIFMAGIGHRIIYRLIDALCCFYVLWVQINQKSNFNLQHELDVMNYMLREQKKQYIIMSETIGDINRKCHDLKHQIRALRYMTDEEKKTEFLDELEHDIMIYDIAMKTGNEAMDIVIMEKGLFCKKHNIQWTCMADGIKLDFMNNEDIYSIFGNSLDNAINAVMKIREEEKRVISVKMITQNKLLTIQIQNYFNEKLEFEDGLPKTTKKNKQIHGYGMKSIQYNVEKYNGIITVNTEEDIFMLQIFIPIPC